MIILQVWLVKNLTYSSNLPCYFILFQTYKMHTYVYLFRPWLYRLKTFENLKANIIDYNYVYLYIDLKKIVFKQNYYKVFIIISLYKLKYLICLSYKTFEQWLKAKIFGMINLLF